SGSLDAPSVFKPQMHMWTASKQPWVQLDDGLPQFEGAPPPN
ncbi:MAG: GFA family protein, partial [Mesorhizobium sp.]